MKNKDSKVRVKPKKEDLKIIIEKKYNWALAEIKKGDLQIKAINIQLAKLQGIVIFAEDLLNISEK